MQNHNSLPTLVLILFVFLSQPIHPQDSQKTEVAPSKLSEYHFVVRGKMSGQRGTRPQQIAQMDNNGEILISCQEAKTSDQLNSIGIPFSQSQLELLTDWNLLTFDNFFFISSDAVPGPDYQQIMALVKDVTADNKVDDPDLAKTLSQFGLCDAQGELTILRLDSDWTIKLESMAKKVYAETILLADSPEMKTILGMETRAQAAMFLHYELRYAFLNYALENGIIEAPIDFDNADNNNPTDKRHLVFMIKN